MSSGSRSTAYAVVDVKGDGSCFYRSVYESARSKHGLVKRIMRLFNYDGDSNVDQDTFVDIVRQGIAKRVAK